jgi:PadR family transcriptional regulator AphA
MVFAGQAALRTSDEGISVAVSATDRNDSTSKPPSVLGCAILQLLSREARSGYDVKKRFEASVGRGWHAYDTQIYRELKVLEETGLAVGERTEGRAGPQRRIYTVTKAGAEALRTWLTSPVDISKVKNEFVLRVWTADLFPPGELEPFLLDIQSQLNATLERETSARDALVEQFGPPEITDNDSAFGRMLCVEHDIAVARTRLLWIERALTVARIRAARSGGAMPGGTSPTGVASKAPRTKRRTP